MPSLDAPAPNAHDPAVTIRRAGTADVAVLHALGAEHAAYEQLVHRAEAAALAAALAGESPTLRAWLAWVGNDAVGYASVTRDYSTLHGAFFLHMDCLYVRAAWRKRAIGHQLWRTVIDAAPALGCAIVEWQTPNWNEGAARFYRRLGADESIKRRYRLVLPASP